MRFFNIGVWVFVLFMGLQVRAEQTVTLVSYTDYPPYTSDKVPEGGLITAIVRAAFDATDVTLVLENVPWNRGVRLVREGLAEGTFPWGEANDLRQEFLHSSAIFAYTAAIYTILPDFKAVEDLEAYRRVADKPVICEPLGTKMDNAFLPYIVRGAIRKETHSNAGTCIKLLRRGTVHIIHASPLTMHYRLQTSAKELGLADMEIPGLVALYLKEVMTADTLHVLFNYNDAGRRAAHKFNLGLKEIIQNGTYRKIIERHLALYPGVDKVAIFKELRSAGLVAN